MIISSDLFILRNCQGRPVDPLSLAMRRLEELGAVRVVPSYNPEHYGAKISLRDDGATEWIGGNFTEPVFVYVHTYYGLGLLAGEFRRAG